MANTTKKKKLYVGCGLTLAPQEFKDQVEATKAALGADWEVMQFLGTTAGTAADVYRVDILENVGGCDAFLGIADEASFGLGFETREALERGKPVLLVASHASIVTRLALGAAEYYPDLMTVQRYDDMVGDVPRLAQAAFSRVLEG